MKYCLTGKKIAAVAVALLAVSAVSCSEKETVNNNESVFETFTGAASYRLAGSAKEFQMDSDVVYSDSISLLMPMKLAGCDVKALQDSIIYKAMQIKGRPVKEAIAMWLDTMANNQEDFKPEKISDTYAQEPGSMDIVEGYVANLTPQVMVYCLESQSYSAGAAHGMYGSTYINYSLENGGSIITLDKLFTADGLKELPARISEQAESMMDKIGPTTITDIPADNNFFISSEGEIVFSYQPYEVASYAQGIVNIPFYPYELADYMTPYAISFFGLTDLINQ